MNINWVEISAHTGQREYNLSQEDVVAISSKREIAQGQALLRDSGRAFYTDHYWFRPMTDRDCVHIQNLKERRRLAFLRAWDSYVHTTEGELATRPRLVKGANA